MAIKARTEVMGAAVAVPAAPVAPPAAVDVPAIVPAPVATKAVPPAGTGSGVSGQAAPEASMTQGVEKAMKTAEEFVAFGQGNLEALVKSGQILAAGLQDMGKQMAATAQAQIEETVSAFKAITSAKSVKDAFDLQAGFARAAVEKTLAESGKFTESSVKLTEQAMAPLTQRWALAVEKFARPVA